MRRRWAAVSILLALAGTMLVGCRETVEKAAGDDPARRRVRLFWEKLHTANEARLRPDCRSAASLYEEALELQPGHEDALYYLGQCRRDLGEPAVARAAFERLVAANPSSARGHLALGALLVSPDPREPMDLAAAESHLRRAHAINGEETGPMVRLGELCLVTRRDAEATEWFEHALRTNPKSVEAAFLAGFLAWEDGSRNVSQLVKWVRDATEVVAPVKGVLNEGDRKDAKRVAAPPLESPLGRLLFGAPIAALRGRAAAGREIDEHVVVALWREARALEAGFVARASAGVPPAPASGSARTIHGGGKRP
jgi:tetratricopeptide (TPR) repeat protein